MLTIMEVNFMTLNKSLLITLLMACSIPALAMEPKKSSLKDYITWNNLSAVCAGILGSSHIYNVVSDWKPYLEERSKYLSYKNWFFSRSHFASATLDNIDQIEKE